MNSRDVLAWVLVGFAIILFFVLITRKSYWLAAISFALIVLVVYLLIRDPKPIKVLQVHEVVEKYDKLLQEKYKYELNHNYVVFAVESLKDSYLIVLKDIDEIGNIRYFPFECNKYEYHFGRGTGTQFADIRQVKHWLQKYSKEPLQDLVSEIIQQDIRKRFTSITGDEDERRQFTTGEETN